MSIFRPFEVEAIRLMTAGVLSDRQLLSVLNAAHMKSYEYTGSGYFLTVEESSLPVEPRTLSNPIVVGNADEIQAGFVIFLGDGELTLECHTWGTQNVPADFRDRSVIVITPPVNNITKVSETWSC